MHFGHLGSVDRFEPAKCIFDIDTLQKQIRGQNRTATHFAESFKKPSGSKFIYKAVDATAFWRDLSGKFHSTKVFVSKVFAFYDMDFPIEFHAEKSKNCQ